MNKKLRYISMAAVLCLVVLVIILIFSKRSGDDQEAEEDGFQTDEYFSDIPDTGGEDAWNADVIIPQISQKYPDKKVLVWLMDEYALGGMSEDWLSAFNDKLIEKGADFVLQMQRISSFNEYYNGINSYINSGNQADLLFTGILLNSGFAGGMSDSFMYAFQNGLLMSFDEYLKSDAGQVLYNVFDDRYWATVSINGSIYGIRTSPHLGTANAVSVSKKLAEQYVLQPMDISGEASSILAIIEEMGDLHHALEFNHDLKNIMPFLGYRFVEMMVAIDAKRGAFNIFEDAGFIDYLNMARTFFELGYLDPDPKGDINTVTIMLPFRKMTGLSDHFYDCCFWPVGVIEVETAEAAVGISSTSEYPDECIRLLSWLFTDQELADLLVFGVPDVNYKIDNGRVVSAGSGQINPFLDSYTGLYLFTTSTASDVDDKYSRYAEYNAEAVMTPLVGFHFNSLGWEGKISELETIVEKYTSLCGKSTGGVRMSFLTGHDDDITGTLLALNEELKAAGIDELVDEVNRQYNEWKQYSKGGQR